MLTKPLIIPTKERIYMDHATFYGMESVKRHIARYKWAASKLKPTDIVMDAGCGSGYGSLILLNSGAHIFGVDISNEAIEYARWKADHLRCLRVEYIKGDLANLTVDKLFDVIVCIETIEHLDQESQAKFMKSVSRILAIGGRFIVTTPIKGEWPTMEYHRHEFTHDEFKEFLGGYFCPVHFDDPLNYGIPPGFMLATCNRVVQ